MLRTGEEQQQRFSYTYKSSNFTCNYRKIRVKEMSLEEELEVICLEKRERKGESAEKN